MLTKVTRSSAITLAVFYVALGVVALALFAFPLWYAWRVTIEDYRFALIKEDVRRFSEVFDRRGDAGLAAFIDERVSLQIAGERILLLTGPDFKPLAGNLAAWPAEVPAAPGDYTIDMALGGHRTQVGLVRAALPGGYNLLVGRDLAHYSPLENRFWFGLGIALTVLIGVGLLGGWLARRAVLAGIDDVSRSVTNIVHGDLSHRLPVTARGGEFDTLALTINRMFDQIEQLVDGVRDVSNSIAHDPLGLRRDQSGGTRRQGCRLLSARRRIEGDLARLPRRGGRGHDRRRSAAALAGRFQSDRHCGEIHPVGRPYPRRRGDRRGAVRRDQRRR